MSHRLDGASTFLDCFSGVADRAVVVIAAFAERTGGRHRPASCGARQIACIGGTGVDERQADGLVILAQSATAGACPPPDGLSLQTGHPAGGEGAGPLMIGSSGAMLDPLERLHRFAACDMPVLITGEGGTGKRLAARAIHERSGRRGRPFVAFNCAAVPPDLLGAELFGRLTGSPSGRAARRSGQIERADQGTLFLDEIDDIPDALQALLLRFLDDGEIRQAGEREPVAVDVRIIAAAGPRLREPAPAGMFREDLYRCLSVLHLHLPPLRERDGDVELLAAYFLHRIGRKLGRELHGFTASALAAMLAHPWPGNVAELLAAVRRGAVLAAGPLVDVADLRLDLPPRAARPHPRPRPLFRPKPASDSEREAVLQALQDSNFNMTRAAQLLGVARATLYRMLARNRIELGQYYRVQPPAPER